MGPHQLMMFCMRLSGMVALGGGPLVKAYSYYFRTSFVIFGTSLFLYAYFEPKPVMEKLETIHYLIALLQIFCKFLSIVVNQEETVDILKTVQVLAVEAAKDQKHAKYVDRANRLSKKITKFVMTVFCGYYPLRVTNLLLKYLVLRVPNPQPFLPSSWIPPVFEKNYILGLFYQVATSLCAGFTNASYSCFIIFLTLHISAQMQVLRAMFEESSPLDLCIVLHQKLLRLFFRVNRLLAGLMFVEIVLSSFYSCVCSFLIIKSLSSGGKDAGNHAHILVLVLVRAFLICYCGNIVIKQGEKLHTSVYFGKWFEQDRKDRKSLLFITTLTTVQPFKYHYRTIVTMDMAQFMKSLQTTYSYLTMLLSLADYK